MATGRTAIITKPPERATHRLAYYLAHGPIPDGTIIRHSCDNPPCCEWQHLLAGTHADNVRDRAEYREGEREKCLAPLIRCMGKGEKLQIEGEGKMENLSERYHNSLAHLEHARLWTPTGVQTISKAPERYCLGAYPIYLDYGQGAHVWDVDGHQYTDFVCGLASLTLGYRHPMVDIAIIQQAGKGISFSLSTRLECELAERICGIFPCGHEGSVRFVKTGSEANEGVIRIARRVTGRDVIVTVKAGYHSWHAWFSAVRDVHPGVPVAMESLVRGFTYNDLASLRAALDSDVAAVILEPTLNEAPQPGFLESVKAMAHAVGALVIFDEVICAGRWAKAGGQEYFGVIPDLATAGKGLANGMPLGCIVGRRDLMQFADVISGTFGGETLSLAACSAVLDIYQAEPVIETLWARGKQLQDGFNVMARGLGVPAICDGFAVKPRIKFVAECFDYQRSDDGDIKVGDEEQTQRVNNLAMSLFLQETALRGILWHPAGGNISSAMTEMDIECALNGMEAALLITNRALGTGDWSGLQGEPIQSTIFVRKP